MLQTPNCSNKEDLHLNSGSHAVTDLLTAAMEDAGEKLAKAVRWCALGINSWDTGISLAPVPGSPLAESVERFVTGVVGQDLASERASGTEKGVVELSALPGAMADQIREATPGELDPFLVVSLTRARGWGHVLESFPSVSLHVRPKRP